VFLEPSVSEQQISWQTRQRIASSVDERAMHRGYVEPLGLVC